MRIFLLFAILLMPSLGLALDLGTTPSDGGVVTEAPQVASTPLPAPLEISVAPASQVPSAMPSTSPGGPEDVVAAQAVVAAVQAPTVFAICAALALVLNRVIEYLRRRRSLASRKKVKVFLACAMALSGGLAAVVPGMPLALAAFVALAPLGAVVINELLKKDVSPTT